MSESLAGVATASALQGEFHLQARVDALQRGDCTEAEFMREVLPLRDSAWAIIALVDQRYRRGLLPDAIFRSVKSKLARHAIEQTEYGTTVELNPSVRAKHADEIRAVQVQPAAAANPVGCISCGDVAQDRAVRDQDGPAGDVGQIAAASCATEAPTASGSPFGAHKGPKLLRDRYALESVLGRGGMGTVLKALDRQRADLPQKSRYVALKILNANTMARPGALADLRREFYCTQALAHPNIVKVYELYCEKEPAFYTMELLEGQLLSDVIERQRPQPLERAYALAIIRDVGAALVHAHARSVVHGDLKPHNIVITHDGEVRILDFGASGAVTRDGEATDALQRKRPPAVTLAYTCCELLDGQQTDPRDDLYALACLSYEMLAGEHPFGRLSSIEARDLGMHPSRPPGMTNRQWHGLELGLSWRREARSASVRDWLTMFDLAPVTERLPPLIPGKPINAQSSWSRAVAPAALIVTLIAGLSVRTPFHAKQELEAPAHSIALVAPAEPPRTAPVAADSPSNLAEVGAPSLFAIAQLDLDPTSHAIEPTPPPIHEQLSPEPAARPAKLADPRVATESQIAISADVYRVPSGETFAEITVRRSSDLHTDGSFVWWTEPASARPGSDFVAQGRTRQLFLSGRHSARLYVRIVPNPTRARMETFYVRIGEPGTGYTLGTVTRAAILIPPLLTARNVGYVDAVSQ
jgi:serine/threonine protein kinase